MKPVVQQAIPNSGRAYTGCGDTELSGRKRELRGRKVRVPHGPAPNAVDDANAGIAWSDFHLGQRLRDIDLDDLPAEISIHELTLLRNSIRLRDRPYSPISPTTPPASSAMTRSRGQDFRVFRRNGTNALPNWYTNHHQIQRRMFARWDGSAW